MLRTVADLMAAFLEQERKVLDEDPVEHGPTIGAMYEGLTRETLRRSLPVANLTVTHGFAIDADEKQSNQLDCILAIGSGEQVPHTDAHRFRVEDIIATVSVKKTLYGSDLDEGYENLRSVYERTIAPGTPVPPIARRAFEQITGLSASREEHVPEHLQILWHILRVEAASPARILFGFHGYKTERSLRQGVLDWIRSAVGKPGYGPMSFPHLIANEHAVVVKANGLPWSAPMQDQKWPFLISSSSVRPVNALLEVIWSRLNYRRLVDHDAFGDDMDLDAFNQLLDARCVGAGWEYDAWPAKVDDRRDDEPQSWEPFNVTRAQGILVLYLQREPEIDLSSPPSGFPPRHELAEDLGILAKAGVVLSDAKRERFKLAPGVEHVFLPDGRAVVGDNSSGRLQRWLLKKI
ncbi:MAG TPA: DUF6602 domain-containing protein [Kofleriaceae bacterium]